MNAEKEKAIVSYFKDAASKASEKEAVCATIKAFEHDSRDWVWIVNIILSHISKS